MDENVFNQLKDGLISCNFTLYTFDEVFDRPISYGSAGFTSFDEYKKYYDNFYYLIFKFNKPVDDTIGLVVILNINYFVVRKIEKTNYYFNPNLYSKPGPKYYDIFEKNSNFGAIRLSDFFDLALKENSKFINFLLFNKDIFDGPDIIENPDDW